MRNINKSNKRALFITYDGLRDPLGQSQILPYLKIISRYVKYLHVISFEKKQTEKQEKVTLPKNVGWTKLTFSHGGIFYKFLDLILMIFKTFLLIKKYKFNILHARSYPSMHVVYLLNKIFDFKSIFDMRGFWVDDRIDANIWSKNKFLYRIIANYYKNLEKKFIKGSDVIIVLTKKAKKEVLKVSKKTIFFFIIPCCADYNHFKPLRLEKKKIIKKKLNINPNTKIISYLGSTGTVYLYDQMIKFFYKVTKYNKKEKFIFLIITRDNPNILIKKLIDLGYKSLIKNIRIVSASRSEVPNYLGISDLMLTLRMPSFSQKAASPTKIAESFSMGIPVISNKGIGDVDEIIKKFNGGLTFNINSQNAFNKAASKINHIIKKGGKNLRENTKQKFSLIIAKKIYKEVYKCLENEKN